MGARHKLGPFQPPLPFPDLFQPRLAPYRVGIYPKLALSIAQAVLDESKLPGICVGGRDAQDDCPQRHVLKDSFLQQREGAGLAQPMLLQQQSAPEGTGGTQAWAQPHSQQGAGTKRVAGLTIFSKRFKKEEKVSLENPKAVPSPTYRVQQPSPPGRMAG